MVNGDVSADSQTLTEFLIHPLENRRQRAFVEMCIRRTCGYLRYFQAKGWSLPMAHQTTGDPHRDLAIDIVGLLLASRRGDPYHRVFEFYRSRGITDFRKTEVVELYDAFKSLLYRFTKQERFNLMAEEDPQKANLKRAFRDTLNTEEYKILPDGSDALVHAARYEKNLREDQRAITFDELLTLVEEVFLQSNSRRQWCRAIFERLNGMKGVRNYLEKHWLLQAVVIVNMKYLEVEGLAPSSTPTAEHSLMAGAIEQARTEALRSMRQKVLAGFVGKGRLTEDYAGRLLLACERFLLDLAHSPGTDPLPLYFREVMPESEHRRYLKHFKHVFETLIHRAKDEFEQRLRKYI